VPSYECTSSVSHRVWCAVSCMSDVSLQVTCATDYVHVCRRWYLWLLPSTREPPGDGMIYKISDRLVQTPRYVNKAQLIDAGYEQKSRNSKGGGKAKPTPTSIPSTGPSSSDSPASSSHSAPPNGLSNGTPHARHAVNTNTNINGDVDINGVNTPAPGENHANYAVDERSSLLIRVEK